MTIIEAQPGDSVIDAARRAVTAAKTQINVNCNGHTSVQLVFNGIPVAVLNTSDPLDICEIYFLKSKLRRYGIKPEDP